MLLAVSVCTYLTSLSSVAGQVMPEISLGFTVIDGRIDDSEATEGEIALFSVQSNQNVSSALNISVNVTQSGNFIGTVPADTPRTNQFTNGVVETNTVTIASGKNIAFIGIALIDDEIDEDNGSVTVSLVEGSSYTTTSNPSKNRKSIIVKDNDLEPVFSIETKSIAVSDTDSFAVRVVSSIQSEKTYAVNLSISSTLAGLIGSSNQSTTLNFAALDTEKTYTVILESSIATSTTSGHPVTVSINNSDSYYINNSKRSVQVHVINGISLPAVSISEGNSAVSEGSPATFTISIPTAITTATTVKLGISSTEDRLVRLSNDTVVIPANTTSVSYILPTESDGATTGSAGSITVAILPGKDYKLGSTSSTSVTITNNGATQMPIMFIQNIIGVNSVTVGSSGTNAEFTIFSNVNSGSNFSVSYRASNVDGNFISSSIAGSDRTQFVNFSPVTGSTTTFSATLEVPVIQDANRKSGVIEVTLIDPTTSTYSVRKVLKSATLRVIKDTSTLPVVSITGGGSYEEGQDGIFYLQADRKPSSAKTVTVSLNDPERYILGSSSITSSATVEITSTNPVPLVISTDGDTNIESDGTITATINADTASPATYDASASPNNTATITITDNDHFTIPTLSIVGLASITEGRNAVFTITASRISSQPLAVNIEIKREGDFFPDVIESKLTRKTITIPTSGQYFYVEPTVADAVAEPAGKVIVSIRASESEPAKYGVRSNFKAEIRINDNDTDNVPEVSIVGGGDIDEGENAFFTIRTNEVINAPLEVRLSISRQGQFFEESGVQNPTITLPISSESQHEISSSGYVYHVPTIFDFVAEADGKIEVSILDDINPTPNYTVGANSRATVVVRDDDATPMLSISSKLTETGVSLHNPINFTVFALEPVAEDLVVNLRGRRTSGDSPTFHYEGSNYATLNWSITIPIGSKRAIGKVNFQYCSTCFSEANLGAYTFTIQNGAGYILQDAFKEIRIDIKSNNPSNATLPIISIAPTNAQSIVAGETASFTLTSDRAITEDLAINYWVSYDQTFYSNVPAGLKSVIFSADSTTPYTQVLEIPTMPYDRYYGDSTLPVQIRDGLGYVIASDSNDSTAEIEIEDNLIVSVQPKKAEVNEGDVVTFIIETNKPLGTTVPLLLNVTDARNYLNEFSRGVRKIVLNPHTYGIKTREGYSQNQADPATMTDLTVHPRMVFPLWGLTDRQEFELQMPTMSDGEITNSNVVSVSILPSSDYQRGTNSAANITVRDTNTRITVVPLNPEVERGGSTDFRIIANSNNLSANVTISVKLGIEASPSAIYSGQSSRTESITLRNGIVTKDITIATTSDEGDDFEIDGLLKVFVKNPDGTSEESFSLPDRGIVLPEGVAVIKVIDDDAPTGISILPLKTHFIEGEPAQFQITADDSIGSDRTISLMIRPRANFTSIVLPKENKSVILSVPTNFNPTHQPSGTVTVTISNGTGYTPATNNSSASVIILDSIIPEFTLATDSVEVLEGQPFDIIINSTPAPQENYHVFLNFSSGDGGTSTNRATFTPASHTFMANADSLTISGMAPSAITKNYLNEFTIQIQPVDLERGRGRANFKLPIFILDSAQVPARSKPEVSVSALASTIFESNMARFEISIDDGNTTTAENSRFVSKKVDKQAVFVQFQLMETGDVLPDFRAPPQSEDYEDGQGNLDRKSFEAAFAAYNMQVSALYECEKDFTNFIFGCWVRETRIFNFPTIFGSGSRNITMKVIEGTGELLSNYQIESSKSSATVTVTDGGYRNPIISIESTRATSPYTPQSEFELGRNLRFRINAPSSAETTITILVDDPSGVVSGLTGLLLPYNDFSFETGRPFVLRLNNGGRRHFNLHTYRTSRQSPADGIVTVKILPSWDHQHADSLSNYLVGSPAMSQVVVRNPNTPTGGVSIFPVDSSILGGETAIFNVKSDTNFTQETTVSISLDDGNSNIIAGTQEQTQQLVFETGTRSKYLRVKTKSLPPFGDSETITATLPTSNDYTVLANNSSAGITVNAIHAIASVKKVTNRIEEGDIAYFEFNLVLPIGVNPPTGGIEVGFTVEESQGFLVETNEISLTGTNSVQFQDDMFRTPVDIHKSNQAVARVVIPILTQTINGSSTGMITVILSNDPTNSGLYEIARAPNNQASISITDSGRTLPELSIEKWIDPVTNQQVDTIVEGAELRTIISISPATTQPLEVEVNVAQTGNFIYTGARSAPTIDYLKNVYDSTETKNLTFSIKPGTTEFPLYTRVGDDRIEEEHGSVTFSLVKQVDYSIERNKASVTIDVMDNDGTRVSISSDIQTISEGDGNGNDSRFSYTLTADPKPQETIMVDVKITGGDDFIKGTPKTMIPMTTSGVATGEVMLEDDATVEDQDTIQIEVIAGTGYFPVRNNTPNEALSNTIEIVVTDNELVLSITAGADVYADDVQPTADFIIEANLIPEKPLAIRYTPVSTNFLASGESEEIVTSPPLAFSQNSGLITATLSVDVHMDQVVDPTGTIMVTLENDDSAKPLYNIGSPASAAVNVYDQRISLNIENASIDEGDSGETALDFEVTISPEANRPISFTWGTSIIGPDNATSGEDFVAVSDGTLEFMVGETTKNISVMINGDEASEPNETFSVTLSQIPVGMIVINSTATGTILNDEAYTPELTISAGEDVYEDDTQPTANFVITANTRPEEPIAVRYTPVSTNFLTPNESNETIASDPLTFDLKDGIVTAILVVDVDVDQVADPTGTIMVTLEDDTNTTPLYTVGSPASAAVNVYDQRISLNIENASIIEGDSGITELNFAVTISPATNKPISLKWDTTIIGLDNAISGEDFVQVSDQTLEFMTGETTKNISVMINGDMDSESNETFTVTLSQIPAGIIVTNATATGTILNDDPYTPELTISAGRDVFENDLQPTADFTIISNAIPNGPIAVRYTPVSTNFLAAGISGVTDTSTPLTFSLNDGKVTATLRVKVDVDQIVDPAGTIMVTLENDTNTTPLYTVGSPASASVNVYDNQIFLNIQSASVIEGDSGITELNFEVTISPATNRPMRLRWGTTIIGVDNATPGEDFKSVRDHILKFDSEETTKNISVMIIGDDIFEPSESFSVTFSQIPTGIIVTNTTAKGIILNDDNVPAETRFDISIFAGSESVFEGSPANFRLRSVQDLPNDGLEISFKVTQRGTFIAWRIPQRFFMTNRSDTLTIHTFDDTTIEDAGSITVTLVEDTANPSIQIDHIFNSATITIKDNDRKNLELSRISVANVVANSLLDLLPTLPSNSPELVRTDVTSDLTRPLVSISTVVSQIDEGTSARFLVMSSNGRDSTNIVVSLQIHQERVQIEGPTKIDVHLNSKDPVSISIPTINNNQADEDGLISVSIMEDSSYLIVANAGTAVVGVSDAVDRQNRLSNISAHAHAFLPNLTGNIGSGTLDIVSNRIELGINEPGIHALELGGQNSISGIITTGGEAINANSTTIKSFLGDSSFAVSLNSGEDYTIPTTVWGLGDYQRISTRNSSGKTMDWSGDLFLGHMGIDTLIREGLLVGISVSVAESEVKFDNTETENIQFDMLTTSLNPYIGWKFNDRNSEFHATAGYGRGEVGIDQEFYEYENLDSHAYTIGLTGSHILLTSDNILTGTSNLSVKSETWFAQQTVDGKDGVLENTYTNSHHLSIRTEGSHQFEFVSGSTLSPIVSIGMRNDERDHQSVLGLEFTGSADYNNLIGFSLSGHGSMLIGQSNQVQKLSLNSSMNYDSNSDEQGLLFKSSTSWEQTVAEIQNSIWSRSNLAPGIGSNHFTDGNTFSSEIGYGLKIWDGRSLLTPFTGFNISQNQGNEYQIGTQMNIGSNLKLNLTGIQYMNVSNDITNKVHIEGSVSW